MKCKAKDKSRVSPAPNEKEIRMLAIGGQSLKEIRIIRSCDNLFKFFVSLLKRDQLRVLASSISQGADAVTAMVATGGKQRGSNNWGVKCYEGSIE